MCLGGAFFLTACDHQGAVKMLWSHCQTVGVFISISRSTNSLVSKLKARNLAAHLGFAVTSTQSIKKKKKKKIMDPHKNPERWNTNASVTLVNNPGGSSPARNQTKRTWEAEPTPGRERQPPQSGCETRETCLRLFFLPLFSFCFFFRIQAE